MEVKMHPEYQYLELLAKILKDGKTKPTRGIHLIKSIFGYQMKFDLRYGFPILTTKKCHSQYLHTNFCGLCLEIRILNIFRIIKFTIGMILPIKILTLVLFMVFSDAIGKIHMVVKSIS